MFWGRAKYGVSQDKKDDSTKTVLKSSLPYIHVFETVKLFYTNH